MRNVSNTCVAPTQDPIIQFVENKRTMRFLNPKRDLFKRVQVDGCAITNGMRCDNLLVSADEQREFFVELKGVDVPKAIEQLRTTIMALGEYANDRQAFIVSTNVAPSYTSTIQKAQKEFRSKFNAELCIKEIIMEYELNG